MLDSLFVQGSWEILHHREWRAYPVLTPREVNFELSRPPGHWHAQARIGRVALFLCCLSKCRYFRFFDFPIFRFSDFPFFSRHFVLSVLVQFRMFRCFAVSIRFLPTLPPDRRGVSLPACGVLLLPDREENVPPPPPSVTHNSQYKLSALQSNLTTRLLWPRRYCNRSLFPRRPFRPPCCSWDTRCGTYRRWRKA